MDKKRTIFRMRSINDNTLKAFFNDEVYASSPVYFNDPYDVLACYDNEKLYELCYTDAEGRNFLINKINELANASGYGYFDDEKISRRHFEISYKKGDLYIRDLGTTNGTLVNGIEVKIPRKLQPGDQIQAGETRFIVGW